MALNRTHTSAKAANVAK